MKRKPQFQLGQSVRNADIKRTFSKGDSTNWSYNLYTIIEWKHDTVSIYRINYLLERYNENLLKSSKLTLDEKNQVMNKLNLLK